MRASALKFGQQGNTITEITKPSGSIRPQKLKKELRRKQRNSFAKFAGITDGC